MRSCREAAPIYRCQYISFHILTHPVLGYFTVTSCNGIFLNQRPRIISRRFWRPPRWGARKPNRVLAVHADPCLSALTGSEPLVRTGAQVGCHRHYRSGYTPTVMLIFIARSFPRSWRMDVRGSQVLLPAPILLHTYVLLFNFQVSERLFICPSTYRELGEAILQPFSKNFLIFFSAVLIDLDIAQWLTPYFSPIWAYVQFLK